MGERIMAIAVSTLLLSAVALTKTSFADSVGKSGAESRSINATAGHEGAEMEMPIPNTPEIDQNAAATTTLELRLANSACPRLAQWVELASKCELVGSEP
jgi:hypothetical protein